MPTVFRDPWIPDGEKSVYSLRLADRPQGFEMTNLIARETGGYLSTVEARIGGAGRGGAELSMTIEQRFKRAGELLRAEHYRAETRSGSMVVSREEANFLHTTHLQFGGGPAPFPVNIMPIAGGLTLLRGIEFAEGHVESINAWLAFSVHWPLIVKVDKRITVEVPAGHVPCWQLRIRPGFAQVNMLLDKVIGGILPPFIAHFEQAPPHRLVRMSFPTQLTLAGPRALMELTA
ncbi:hypothetical protein ACFXNW_22385 [Nocardia sp. NPDC059180]|uniref:hypothetical protein n=1 Tax=Nocardia sp. NPDC059180 TaxID=3346761 RepID=UPI0036B6C557